MAQNFMTGAIKSDNHRTRRRDSLICSLSAGSCDSPGKRSKMEDTHWLHLAQKVQNEERSSKRMKTAETGPATKNSSPVSFFLVCDGHGGCEVADYVNAHLYDYITRQGNLEEEPEAAITNGFLQIEAELAKDETLDGGIGTTVTAALIIGHTLVVANIGDSEAVICSGGKAVVLTDSHTPANSEEKIRIQSEGGVIIEGRREPRLGHPVWNPTYVNLGVTRAIGDFYFKNKEFLGEKKSGLIAMPKITRWNLTTADEFVLIASDGFWNVVSHSEAVDFVSYCLHFNTNTICKALIELGQSRNSKDNITVVLVKMKNLKSNFVC